MLREFVCAMTCFCSADLRIPTSQYERAFFGVDFPQHPLHHFRLIFSYRHDCRPFLCSHFQLRRWSPQGGRIAAVNHAPTFFGRHVTYPLSNGAQQVELFRLPASCLFENLYVDGALYVYELNQRMTPN